MNLLQPALFRGGRQHFSLMSNSLFFKSKTALFRPPTSLHSYRNLQGFRYYSPEGHKRCYQKTPPFNGAYLIGLSLLIGTYSLIDKEHITSEGIFPSKRSSVMQTLLDKIDRSRKDDRLLLPELINFEDIPSVPETYLRIGFSNLKTAYHDAAMKEKGYPYLTSENRYPYFATLIQNNSDVFGFYEGGGPKGLEPFISHFTLNFKFVGYSSGKKGEHVHMDIDTIQKMIREGKKPYKSEIVGVGYNSDKVILLNSYCEELLGCKKYCRIATVAIFETRDGIKFVIISAHLDDISAEQRKEATVKLKELAAKFDPKTYDVFTVLDSNYFPDVNGKEDNIELSSLPNYNPMKVVENHYGPPGTAKGDPTWKQNFLAPISQAAFGHLYKNGNLIDVIRATVPPVDKEVILMPVYTAHLPGYFDPLTGKIFKLSDKIPKPIIEGGFAASDHSFVVTCFKPEKRQHSTGL